MNLKERITEFSKRSDKGGSLEEVLSTLRLAEEIIAAQQKIIDISDSFGILKKSISQECSTKREGLANRS